MQRVSRIIFGLIVVLAFAIGAVIGWTVYDLNTDNSANVANMRTENSDGEFLNAYLALPDGNGPFPAVMLIHEWWGLREDITVKADRLAEQGYVVLAVDAYRGTTADTVPGALFLNLTYDQALIDADMTTFYEFLAARGDVDTSRLAVLGYCFGGRQAVRYGTNNPADVAAILTYYGGGQINTVDGLQPLADEDVAVLGVFGEEDNSIPPEDVEQFESALTELDIPHQITVYPGVGHAFVTPDALDDAGSAAAQAWQEGLDFLEEQFAVSAPVSSG